MSEEKPILLVDDSEQDVELMIAALREDGRISNAIDIVYDGEEALDYLFRRGKFENRTDVLPAVVIQDLKMPKVSGFEVLERIKNDEKLCSVPVVIFSSSKEEQDIVQSYAYGANAFVEKSVDSKQFVEAIKQIGLFWTVINIVPDQTG